MVGGSEKETRTGTVAQKRVLIGLCMILALLAGVAGGYFLRGTSASNSVLVPIITDTGNDVATPSVLGARVEEVQDILSKEAYDPSDTDTATAAIISALLQNNGDIYGKYFTATQYASYLNMSSGEFGGIGILISEYEGRAYVVRVFPDTPAEAAGLEEGDFITVINGDARSSWSSEEVASLISGQPGELVEIGWLRPDSRGSLTGTTYSAIIECATIQIPNVEYQLIDGDVGYISVSQFTRKSTEDVSAALAALEEQGAAGYLLDVRGNPGGYLAQAVEVASMFLSSGTVVQIDSRTAGSSVQQVSSDFYRTDKPLTVLVNENSASAAEILASALQDQGRATIVGTVTFGKGTVQTIKELSFGGGIKYTIAHYLTPNGKAIDGIGVTPDILIEMDATNRATDASDEQFSAALANVHEKIATQQAAQQAAQENASEQQETSGDNSSVNAAGTSNTNNANGA